MSSVANLTRRPLYLQVCDLLAERIAAGEWKPGGILPNEVDLARELGVSTGTVRKALDKLEVNRMVVRRQGLGTFVVDHGSQEMAVRFDRFHHGDGKRVWGQTQVLERAVYRATEEEQTQLRIRSDEAVLRTRRLQRQSGRPFVLELASVAISRLPGFEPNGSEDCPITSLAQRYGVHLAHASERIFLAPTTPEEAKLLLVEPGNMVLKLDRLIFSIEHRPVEWRLALLSDTDRCQYFATMR